MFFNRSGFLYEADADPSGAAGEGAAPGDAGQGGEGDAGQFGGFDTLDELVSSHEAATGQVTELESLKGRQGTEMERLNTEIARQGGEINAFRNPLVQAQPGPDAGSQLDTLGKRYDAGEITLPVYQSQRDVIRDAERDKGIDARITQSVNTLRQETDDKAYAASFVSENPGNEASGGNDVGYSKAFNTGLLNDDMRDGLSAQHAYTQYQLRQKNSEIETLKGRSKEEIDAAKKIGAQEGVKLEQGKLPAGKVTGDAQGSFSEGAETVIGLSKTDQRKAGVALIARRRAGGG